MGIHNIDALINLSEFESNDETDVPAALERKTQDGSGFGYGMAEDTLPPSDFDEEDL